ncbi:MAG: hypothetical protein AVDCRST_MAG04-2326, partial [uncultured Acetobacteraceae bacterium]
AAAVRKGVCPDEPQRCPGRRARSGGRCPVAQAAFGRRLGPLRRPGNRLRPPGRGERRPGHGHPRRRRHPDRRGAERRTGDRRHSPARDEAGAGAL